MLTNCEHCDLRLTCRTPCIGSRGSSEAPLFLIGEAPGFEEDFEGVPFVGKAGQLLDHVLKKLGLRPDKDIFVTNLIRCRPPKNKLPTGKALEELVERCWPFLVRDLQAVDPQVVVLLGGIPLHQLTGNLHIKKWEGMETETVYEGARTFAAFHPAFVLRQPSKESNLARALFVAAEAAGLRPRPKGLEAGLYDYDIRH